MMEEKNREPLEGLPPDLAELDAELAEMMASERPSFAPELQAELTREWVRRPLRTRGAVARQSAAAVFVAISVLGVAVSPARASLVGLSQRFLTVFQDETAVEVALPMDDASDLPISTVRTEDDAGAALDPALAGMNPVMATEDLPRFVPAIMTMPRLIDRKADAALARQFYPRTLQLAGVGGTVELSLWVDSTGSVDHVQMRETSGVPELDRAGMQAARELQFFPATRNGEADGTWVEFPLTFTPNADEAVLPIPETPGVPEELGWEVPDDWSEATSVPAPIQLETRELLQSAMGDSMEDIEERFGPIDGLLEGDAPAGANPLEWRTEAATALEWAMVRDPENPAPYLALARIRRKQGLRDDARMLFGRGVDLAQRGTRPISPRLVAELAWENGRVTREAWLGWRGLGEVSPDAMSAARCGSMRGAPGGVVAPEELIVWNFNCPEELNALFTSAFEYRAEGEVQAGTMLASFREAVEAYPAHVEANTEILLALADEGAWQALLNGSRRFAWASQGHPWSLLMSGLALHRLNRSEEALLDFEQAFQMMGPRQRAAFDETAVLQSSSTASSGPAFWRTLDPILNTAVNERLVEHYARAAYAFLRFNSLEADAAKVWLRYGRPNAIRSFGTGSGMRTEFWDYGQGPDITFHRPSSSANGALTSEAEDYLEDLSEVFPNWYGTLARGSYSLPARVSRFRGRMQGSTEVEFHFSIPTEMFSSSTDSLELGLFLLGPGGEDLLTSRRMITATEREQTILAPAGAEVSRVAVEVYNPRLGMAAGIRVPAHEGARERGPGISTLMLTEAAMPLARDIERGDSWVNPRRDARLDAAQVGVLFEVYDLQNTDAPYRLSFELVSEDDGSRTAIKVRPAGQETWGLEWLRAPLASRTVEYVTLDLASIPAGRYTIRGRIDLEDGTSLVQELPGLARHVELPATQIPRGGWESEWEMGSF